VKCPYCEVEIVGPDDHLVETEKGLAHEHCADPEDVIAAGSYRPDEDYPGGDY
jgi:hypothetical protein